MSRPIRLALSSAAAVTAVIITFLVSVYVQGAFWGDKALQSDAGPQFGVIALAGLVAIVIGALVFAVVLKVSRSRAKQIRSRTQTFL